MWLFLILVAIPLIEIGLFIQVGGFLGLWWTLLIVVITAFIGSAMMRVQGLATLEILRDSVNKGENPSFAMANGALILVAGLLLLTPGFFTDAVGFSLLIPPIRALLIKFVTERASAKFYNSAANTRHAPQGADVIDAEFEVLNENNTKPGDSGWTKEP